MHPLAPIAFARHSERSEESLYFARGAPTASGKPQDRVRVPHIWQSHRQMWAIRAKARTVFFASALMALITETASLMQSAFQTSVLPVMRQNNAQSVVLTAIACCVR